jgi:dienelactone hydrolase
MTQENFKSGGTDVPVSVSQPATTGTHPAVLLAYGTRGLNAPFGTAILNFARDLASAGYVALVPHYLERTGTPAAKSQPGDLAVMDAFMEYRDVWIDTLGDCLSYAANRADVAANRTGVVGFSMGAHLMLRLAKADHKVKVNAVVSFFAPITQPQPFFNGLGDGITKLPPVQIHHGETDSIVDPRQSHELTKVLKSAGKVEGRDYELYRYPGQGHGFDGPDVGVSTRRTIGFLDLHTLAK